MDISKDQIALIVKEVLDKYSGGAGAPAVPSYGGRNGIFPTMDEAVDAAEIAQKQFIKLTLDTRKQIIESIRRKSLANVRLLAEMAVSETGMGRVEDKIAKKTIAATKTPGIEDLVPEAYTGDGGLTLVEHGPFGLVGSITPSTNPGATVINNTISMIAAGNGVVFNFHPSAKRVSQKALTLMNEAIQEAGGPPNLVTTVENPTMQTSVELMKHKKIRLMAVTGGPEVVHTAMTQSGKRVIGAGPGNPPVVVDETADLDLAGREIVLGASFDNNIMCTCEKEVFCVDAVCDELIRKLQDNGAFLLNAYQTDQLTANVINPAQVGQKHPTANKKFVGKNASVLAKSIGLDLPSETRLLICEVHRDHPLLYAEQLMPVLPICRVRNVEEAIELAVHAEHGFMHTASMFSKSVENLSRMAYRINATIFVKNAATLAGLGGRGEGHTSLTIAGPTGEGPTSARSFTRYRRCVLVDYFRII
ncbi:MAG: aldehyde dehydrogenase EutE [Firmicutes bacterium]|nr:aldehyde dehydrogenase EutE [Bacillota bacterium]